MKVFYAEKDWIAERIESLEGDLRAIARMSPLAAVNYIRQGMGYDEYLIEYAAFRRMRPEELLETADELKESAAGFKTVIRGGVDLQHVHARARIDAPAGGAAADGDGCDHARDDAQRQGAGISHCLYS